MNKLMVSLLVLLLVFGCKDDDGNDSDLQIAEYIAEQGLTSTAIETPEGLFYVLTEEGGTEKPNLASDITINYVGRFVDGGIFDQSGASPATFPLSNLIRGWQIGIPFMGKGGKATLIIPPELGYGPNGTNGIPGNSVLVFDIELIDFQ